MVIVLIFSDTYVRPKIHRIQKKRERENSPVGGGEWVTFMVHGIYTHSNVYLLSCVDLF